MASNKVLWQILEPFGKQYCFTEAIIQGVRKEAHQLIFGDAYKNVGYVFFVKEDLMKAGHHVQLSFCTCKETMQNLDKIMEERWGLFRVDIRILVVLDLN